MTEEKKMKKSKEMRGFVGTEFDLEAVVKLRKIFDRYFVWGNEVCPTTGRKHGQWYGETKNATTFKRLLKKHKFSKLLKREGTPKQASDYCKKEGDFEEHGTLPAQGKRSDMAALIEDIDNGLSRREIAVAHPNLFVRCHRGIDEYIRTTRATHEGTQHTTRWYDFPIDWTKTQVFIGSSGCGKTTYAMQLLPRALFVTHMDDLGKYNPENYHGIIFDEASLKHLPRESQIHLLDQDQRRSIHIRYTTASIPAHTPKILSSNREAHDIFLVDPATLRRVQIHNMDLLKKKDGVPENEPQAILPPQTPVVWPEDP